MPPMPAPDLVTPQAPTPTPAPVPAPAPTSVKSTKDYINIQSSNYNGGPDTANFMSPSPSRWWINFRTTLEKVSRKWTKRPEEISAAMRKMGYNRNAK
ncbi:hypothetical protein AgCh_037868 [Apium graveolens]